MTDVRHACRSLGKQPAVAAGVMAVLALAIALRQGRAFSAADRHDTAPVAVINETFARHYFHTRAPVGARMRLNDGRRCRAR
jgi:hypothetical protein